MDKHHIIVSSKHNENPSKIRVSLDNDLVCKDNEYWSVKIESFNMIKSFYAVQDNLNNGLNIWLKNKTTGVFDEPYFRAIAQGNYTVRTLITELKEKLFGLVDISYDSRLNKILFKRLEVIPDDTSYDDPNDYDVYIEAINSSVFLGIPNNEKVLITNEGVYSTTYINVNGYTTMMLKITDGISIDNSLTNITNPNYEISKVLAIIDLQQVRPMDSIILSNHNDTNYKITNKKINNFTIEIVNENNVSFPQMSDYVLNLCFEKKSHQNELLQVIKYISSRLNDLIFYILFAFDKMNIAEPNFS